MPMEQERTEETERYEGMNLSLHIEGSCRRSVQTADCGQAARKRVQDRRRLCHYDMPDSFPAQSAGLEARLHVSQDG